MSVPGQHAKRMCRLQVASRTFDVGPVHPSRRDRLNVLLLALPFEIGLAAFVIASNQE
jgi:hypothetical protein